MLGYNVDAAAKKDSQATQEELSHYDRQVAADKEKQIRTPWMRDGSDKPPVATQRSAGAMTKGKLLTTPSRLLKLVLPLSTADANSDRKDVEPLALLVHPQQPLSYLERLIQAELPLMSFGDETTKRPPNVHFRAVDVLGHDEAPESANADADTDDPSAAEDLERYERARRLRGAPGQGGVETYSGAGRETTADASAHEDFVRWSKSTEVGDFIRDAARGAEFSVEVEGAPREIRVGVPSFNDRTYYLRMRLRKRADQLAAMARVKKECDALAHRYSQRVAYAGFGGMIGWGALVSWLTFMTDLGWDTMEPITYLVGLVGLLGGYGWFLFNRREASYQSAMNLTVSRKQNAEYQKRGFDLSRWQGLVDEANSIRREIVNIASEYDVEWDETRDAHDESVVKELKKHRRKKGKKEDEGKNDEDEDDD